jgi:hypothetical protein
VESGASTSKTRKESSMTTIAMKQIKSSQIEAYGYDEATKTLAIKFNKGTRTYFYPGVPADLIAGFEKDSAGKHFLANIRPKFKPLPPDNEKKA